MSIEFNCPSCGRTLRVAERFAGRKADCPACAATLTVPDAVIDDAVELEIVPEDKRTYEVIIEQAKAPKPPPKPQPTRLAEPTAAAPTGEVRPSAEAFANLERPHYEREKTPWWNREILELFGVGVTVWWLLFIPLALGGALAWYVTGPGKAALLTEVQPVMVVEALNTGQTLSPQHVNSVAGQLGLGTKSKPTSVGTLSPRAATLSVGGNDELLVTQPDTDGDYVRINVALKQGLLNNLGHTSGYNSTIRASDFALHPAGQSATATNAVGDARLITADFDQPIDLELANAQTTRYQAMLPPDPPTTPDRLDTDAQFGVVTGEAEYILGQTRGKLTFTSGTSYQGAPAAKGLSANGRLQIDHPNGGPRVELDYQGRALRVGWNPQSTAHWVQSKMTRTSRTSPWDRFEFSLLLPRPVQGGKYTLTYAGRDLGTIKLGRMKQPSRPAPSPLASNRPGGPQAQSKNANSPLAYFDVLRDAKSRAQGIVSAKNMQQIGLAFQLYLDQHRKFPESLAELVSVMPEINSLMQNPRTGDQPGFIYQKPPEGANPATTPILFESFEGQIDDEGAILYGDGSIR